MLPKFAGQRNRQRGAATNLVDIEVDLRGRLELPIQRRYAAGPNQVLHLVLEDKQLDAKLLFRQVQEASKLGHGHGGVELEEATDGGELSLLLNLVSKDLELLQEGLLVVVRVHVVIVGHHGGEELGASVTEELLVDLSVPLLHAQHLIAVLLSQLQVDALVYAHGVHGEGDGKERVHLLVLLVNLRPRGEPVSLAHGLWRSREVGAVFFRDRPFTQSTAGPKAQGEQHRGEGLLGKADESRLSSTKKGK